MPDYTEKTETDWPDLAEEFLAECTRLLSSKNVEYKHLTLERFLRFLKEEKIAFSDGLSVEAILKYEQTKPKFFTGRSQPRGERPTEITLGFDSNHLRSFLRYLHREGYTIPDLSACIPRRKNKKTLPRAVPAEVIEEWFSLCDLSCKEGLRDRAVFETAYGSGLRPGELMALTLPCLDLQKETPQVRVERSKNGEARLVPLTQSARYHLLEYLEKARPWFPTCPKTRETLWLTSRGTHCTTVYYGHRVKTYYQPRLSQSVKITMHALRHSFATHLLRGGANLRQVQTLLGHIDLESTKVYTQVEISDLKKMQKQFHPRSRRRSCRQQIEQEKSSAARRVQRSCEGRV